MELFNSINTVVLLGEMISNPEIKETQNKKKFATFVLRTEKPYLINNQIKKSGINHNIVCYNNYAIQALQGGKGNGFGKGAIVKVIGEIGVDKEGKMVINVNFMGEIGVIIPEEMIENKDEKNSVNSSSKSEKEDIFSKNASGSMFNSDGGYSNATGHEYKSEGRKDNYDDDIPF